MSAPAPSASPVRPPAVAVGAILAIVGAALIWSTSFAVTKVVLEEVPPLTIGAIRFTAAAALLAVAVRLQGGWRPLPVGTAAKIGAAGFLGITAYFALENIGVDLATASDAALIVASYPIITLALEFFLHRQRASLVRITGMLLAVAGVWLIVRAGAAESGQHRLLGDLILVLGGVVWAAYNLAVRRTGHRVTPLTATYYQTIAGALGFLLLAPLEHQQWQAPGVPTLFLLAYLAVACSVAAFLLYNAGLRRASATTAVNLLNLVPVFGLLFAVLFAGESVGAAQLVGGAVVIVGVTLGLHERDTAAPVARTGRDEPPSSAPTVDVERRNAAP